MAAKKSKTSAKVTKKTPAKRVAAKTVKPRKAATTAASPGSPDATRRLASRLINEMGGWREETLARMRELIREADPDIVEEQKWRKPSNAMTGVPTWSRNGIICTGEIYKNVVKLTFARGAKIPDPAGLFNASLEGNTRRAIDIREGEKVDARAFKSLIKAAVALNTAMKNR